MNLLKNFQKNEIGTSQLAKIHGGQIEGPGKATDGGTRTVAQGTKDQYSFSFKSDCTENGTYTEYYGTVCTDGCPTTVKLSDHGSLGLVEKAETVYFV